MLNFGVRRSLVAVISLIAISMITYIIVQMPPGDYVDTYIQLSLAPRISTFMVPPTSRYVLLASH